MFQQNPLFKKKKILVVDDEPFNLLALRSILKTIGIYNLKEICVEAMNGKQALEIIVKDVEDNNELYSCFDLILMDYQMPIMDGNEATHEIREYLYSKGIN